jgi:hypothetical protein
MSPLLLLLTVSAVTHSGSRVSSKVLKQKTRRSFQLRRVKAES